MALNRLPKPKTEKAWQVWQVVSIVIPTRSTFSIFSLLFFFYAIVLKKAAIPAIVLRLPYKQAENSMAGCCNNLPSTCHSVREY
jgi:hypothetical protein